MIVRSFSKISKRCTYAHRDKEYFKSQNPNNVATCWIPLGQVGPLFGQLIYLLGSQFKESKIDKLVNSEKIITKDLGDLSKNLNLNWIRPIIEEGDVIYHSLEIVHASFDSSSNIPRLSIDLRFSASDEDHDPRWSNPWRGMMDFKLLGYDEEFLLEISQKLDLVVRSGFWSGGKYAKSIEETFSKLYGMGAVSCSSGGMALELVCKAFPDIKKIAVQSNTYFASALPWINKKTELILLGSNNYSLTPSLELVKEASKLGINAIILTHIGGYPIPEIQKITKFCNENQILLFEDCAHSPLTKIDNLYVGSFGDASIFSFSQLNQFPQGGWYGTF